MVTGGSRGIGRAVVDRALAGGDRVVVLARSAAGSDRPAGRVLALAVDVADPASVAAAFEQLDGPVDVLVNSAGVHRGGLVEQVGDAAWNEVLATNLTGAFTVVRAARPLLVAGSAVVNIGAVVGLRGFAGDVAYGSAKAGLSGLTQTLAIELARDGIRVNLVVPGFVETDMTDGIPAAARERIVAGIPLGRPGRAAEIADVVWSVAGSSYMTGSTVAVDGGLLASFGAPARRVRDRAGG
ncbi:SDR family oxidoreductase [Pseudonocardia petroleophila]|uniref:SDR family oxidoreductase n=1 Tax=Pseudonocardia petroleophila TaxID=37331 RepID=A0A7G7MS78_9PSEU|nr:SDR family oxidoreductase [Pseudonocardia petroleophila]